MNLNEKRDFSKGPYMNLGGVTGSTASGNWEKYHMAGDLMHIATLFVK
jgi:hypothetical protein